ncbi:hypothetical protein AAKU67_004363 [Oxalobacteraceae bacterium GrIS 2.11]
MKGNQLNTEEYLLKQYGSPLLSLLQLSKILNRSPDGLRITLSGNSDLAKKLRPIRVKIGRRVFFRTSKIAEFIDEA